MFERSQHHITLVAFGGVTVLQCQLQARHEVGSTMVQWHKANKDEGGLEEEERK